MLEPNTTTSPVTRTQTSQRLLGWDRLGLAALVVTIIIFGAIVERRSAFLTRRMTDADVYFRAAWAVRTGHDMYSVVDANGWHYSYPPLFAILLMPLAAPPPGTSADGFVPYPVSVALWYIVSVGLFLLAVHWLARALERAMQLQSKPWKRRWVWLRMGTILICLMAVGRTLSRGQANMILLICFSGMIAFLLNHRRFAAGLCLSVPISIKIFPALVLVVPMIRRDWRWLLGCACGLFVALILLPVVVLGPQRTTEAYQRYKEVLFQPALAFNSHPEVTRAYDSQSFAAILHNVTHPDRARRPTTFAPWIRPAHWLIGGAFMAVTLVAGYRARRRDAIGTTLFLGALILVTLPISPVCHIHYFIFAMPLVMGLLAAMWERTEFPAIEPTYAKLFSANIILNILPSLPALESWKDFGVPLWATLLLWGAALVELMKRVREQNGVAS